MCSRHFGAQIGLVETLVPLPTMCGSLNDLSNFTEAHVFHLLNVSYQHMLDMLDISLKYIFWCLASDYMLH